MARSKIQGLFLSPSPLCVLNTDNNTDVSRFFHEFWDGDAAQKVSAFLNMFVNPDSLDQANMRWYMCLLVDLYENTSPEFVRQLLHIQCVVFYDFKGKDHAFRAGAVGDDIG